MSEKFTIYRKHLVIEFNSFEMVILFILVITDKCDLKNHLSFKSKN